jgi:hypothetical protein
MCDARKDGPFLISMSPMKIYSSAMCSVCFRIKKMSALVFVVHYIVCAITVGALLQRIHTMMHCHLIHSFYPSLAL